MFQLDYHSMEMSKIRHRVAQICILFSSYASFGICPHMTDDNKDQLKGKDLLVAYYDVDYEKNPKGSNYWRNR